MELLILGAVVLVLVLLLVGFVVVPRRRGGAPPAPPAKQPAPPPAAPPVLGKGSATAEASVAPAPAEAEVEAPAAEARVAELASPEALVAEPAAPVAEAPPLSTRERFRLRLGRARGSLGAGLAGAFRRGVDEQAWEDLEEALIAADVGVEAALEIVSGLRDRAKAEGVRSGEQALALLKEVLRLELAVADRTLRRRDEGPTVWLFTGVNGTGKTTSIGKLAARHRAYGDQVVLAAADTFRAAASEQLEHWGERSGCRVVRHAPGADPAAVAFDGWQAAKAADANLLMVDTAGRLQNKTELMAELSKVKRVLERDAGQLDEVLLVLDATTGQNGLSQAKAFMEAADVTGVVLTKLDGTAKGGIVVAIQRQLGIPVKLVGLGEGIDDLADFDPDAFVEALFAEGAQDAELDEAGLDEAGLGEAGSRDAGPAGARGE